MIDRFQDFLHFKKGPLYTLYFNQTMIEVINSRNVPDLFKDHFVKFILFSYFIAVVCIVLRELYVYKP